MYSIIMLILYLIMMFQDINSRCNILTYTNIFQKWIVHWFIYIYIYIFQFGSDWISLYQGN